MLTNDEAKTIAKIISTVDGNCITCAHYLADRMQKAFPKFSWRKLVDNSGTPLVENPLTDDDYTDEN